jgi:hypothetical protein
LIVAPVPREVENWGKEGVDTLTGQRETLQTVFSACPNPLVIATIVLAHQRIH